MAHQKEAGLRHRVVRIVINSSERVSEDRGCLLETHLVAPQILLRLLVVLGEFDRTKSVSLHGCLSLVVAGCDLNVYRQLELDRARCASAGALVPSLGAPRRSAYSRTFPNSGALTLTCLQVPFSHFLRAPGAAGAINFRTLVPGSFHL